MTQVQAFKAAGLPAVDMGRFKTVVKAAAQAARSAASGAVLLRLLRDGIWVYGPDDVEVQEGSLWAINPFSLAMGYAAWGEEKTALAGTLVGERMALITEPQVDPNSLPDHQHAPWRAQVQFDAVCLNGDDVGVTVRYKTTSTGGRRAFAGLVQEVSNQADNGDQIVPVVSLGTDSYQHKQYGRTYVPVFDIAEWKSPIDTSLGDANGEKGDADERDAPTKEPPKEEPTRSRRPAATRGAASRQTATEQTAEQQPQEPRQRRAAAAPAEQTKPPVERGAVVRRRRA